MLENHKCKKVCAEKPTLVFFRSNSHITTTQRNAKKQILFNREKYFMDFAVLACQTHCFCSHTRSPRASDKVLIKIKLKFWSTSEHSVNSSPANRVALRLASKWSSKVVWALAEGHLNTSTRQDVPKSVLVQVASRALHFKVLCEPNSCWLIYLLFTTILALLGTGGTIILFNWERRVVFLVH